MNKNDLSLVEYTQSEILKYISNNNCKLLPKEQEFTELLGVSRVVVREALSRLRVLGFIETKRKQGTKVVTPNVFGVLKTIVASGLIDYNSLKDLYQLRLMLEIGMSDFVYANKTDEQMAKLEKIVAEEVMYENEMSHAENEEQKYEIAKKMTDVDIRFHGTLYEMTGNSSLMDFQYLLRHLFTLYVPRIKDDFHNRTLVSHVSLFNMLRNSTPDAFRMGMRLHLKTQFDNMERILENSR